MKPGDWGEDTISLHVNNNDSYLCADVTLTKNDDMSSTEPELASPDAQDTASTWDGELANHLRWYWWADDGDNVYETCPAQGSVGGCVSETLLSGSGSALPNADGTFTSTVALADSQTNVWGDLNGTLPGNGPLPGDSVRYIAKAWCFGESSFLPKVQDGLTTQGPNVIGRGVQCDGSAETNITQTDGLTMDISFRAVQSRNNTSFVCSTPTQGPEIVRVTSPELQFGSTGWGGWSCPAGQTAVSGGVIGATQSIAAQGLAVPLANIDGSIYPVFPHYTFGTNETGYVVHNGAVGQNLQIFVDCQL